MIRVTKKRLIIIVIVAIAIMGIWRSRMASNSGDRIKTAEVVQSELTETVSSSGKTKAKQEANLHFQTGGRLAWVGVREGDTVRAYQTIAALDSRELEKNLTKTLRDYSKERNDFEEDRLLTYKDRVMTDTIKRILEKNQWDLDKAVLDVEIKSLAIEWARLVSPIAGRVVRVDTPVAGINVTTADTFTIANPDSIVFTANVDEVDIGKIREGLPAVISLDAYSEATFSGKVARIAFTAETSSGGATVFPVEIAFDAPTNIRSGLNGDVSITVNEISNTLSVPEEAVQVASDGTHFVIKLSGKRYEKITVTVGATTETDMQILQGLTDGDEVVVDGFQFLPKELTNGKAT